MLDQSQVYPVVRTSLAIRCSIYIAMSIVGFVLFGDSTLDDFVSNFDVDLGGIFWLSYIVRATYTVHLVLVFPYLFHPLRVYTDGLFFPSSPTLETDRTRSRLLTIGLISFIFIAAYLAPSIWYSFELTEASSELCLGIMFPALIVLRDPHGIATSRDKRLAITMIVIGIFTNIMAICSDVYSFFW